jgi:hypothetical protein
MRRRPSAFSLTPKGQKYYLKKQRDLETVVRYTYRIESAPWMSDREARKVFPVVDKIIRGAGKLEMTASVRQQDGKWVPLLPRL